MSNTASCLCVLSLAGLMLTACESHPTEAELVPLADTIVMGTPPPPFVAYQDGDFVLGRLVYSPCGPPYGGWRMDWLPEGDPMILDLYYIHQGPDIPFPGLWHDNFREVVNSGAEIVRPFNMGVIRVRASRESLLWLAPSTARAVPDPSRFDVGVSVGVVDSSVVARFEGLGGWVSRFSSRFSFFKGMISDYHVPELRSEPSVTYVEHWRTGTGCLLDEE